MTSLLSHMRLHNKKMLSWSVLSKRMMHDTYNTLTEILR